MEKIKELLISNLLRLRESQGLSQESLAERASLNATHLSQIETGRRWPKPSTIEAIANGLDVPISELFRDDSLPSHKTGPEEALKILSDFIAGVNKN